MGDTEIYDSLTGQWSSAGTLLTPRSYHTTTLLPDGRVLVVGGSGGTHFPALVLSSVELFDPSVPTWSQPGDLLTARTNHTATLLSDGHVLVTGGYNHLSGDLNSAEVYDPATRVWNTSASLREARQKHTATLLNDGSVLVVGGCHGSGDPQAALASAEIYDPIQKSWGATGSLAAARCSHNATLLDDGMVLVTGGENESGPLASAEIYDPRTRVWHTVNSMATPRVGHTATLLRSGSVLVVGGEDASGPLASAEVFDPETGIWRTTSDSLSAPRAWHSATLLPNGKVLVAGGKTSAGGFLNTSELYRPSNDRWGDTGTMLAARADQKAMLLLTSRVLIVGGENSGGLLGAAELNDPSTRRWSATGSLNKPRTGFTLTLLPDGTVLIVGGNDASVELASTERYDSGLGFLQDWQPVLDDLNRPIIASEGLSATGDGWRGYHNAQASGGSTNSSPTNYPLVQLYRLDNGETTWLNTRTFSATLLTTRPIEDVAPGPALLTVFVNGIPSKAQYVKVMHDLPNTYPVYLPILSNR